MQENTQPHYNSRREEGRACATLGGKYEDNPYHKALKTRMFPQSEENFYADCASDWDLGFGNVTLKKALAV